MCPHINSLCVRVRFKPFTYKYLNFKLRLTKNKCSREFNFMNNIRILNTRNNLFPRFVCCLSNWQFYGCKIVNHQVGIWCINVPNNFNIFPKDLPHLNASVSCIKGYCAIGGNNRCCPPVITVHSLSQPLHNHLRFL